MGKLAADLACALDPALLMTEAGLAPDSWQRRVLRSTARQTLLLCSRQTGKSTVAALSALDEAAFHPPALVLILAPTMRQSGELFRRVLDALRLMPIPPGVKAESALRLDLTNGSRVIALPGTDDTVRGYSGVRLLVIDEAAYVADDLYFSVRPMLAVSRGRLVALGTPHGKRGWFFDAWTNGGAEWERVRVPATECPRISPAFLEAERSATGEAFFRQEYLCEFVERDDQVFPTDYVEAAFTLAVKPLAVGA